MPVVEETGVPSKTTAYLQVIGNFLACPGQDSNSNTSNTNISTSKYKWVNSSWKVIPEREKEIFWVQIFTRTGNVICKYNQNS